MVQSKKYLVASPGTFYLLDKRTDTSVESPELPVKTIQIFFETNRISVTVDCRAQGPDALHFFTLTNNGETTSKFQSHNAKHFIKLVDKRTDISVE